MSVGIGQDRPRRPRPAPTGATAGGVLLAVIVVHWFAVNVFLRIGNTSPVSMMEKVSYGIKTAVFLEPLDTEGFIIVMIGMSAIPVLLGIAYVSAVVSLKRWHLQAEHVPFSVGKTVLRDSWVWMVYWPVWTVLYGVAGSWPVVIGGVFVMPPVLAAGIGWAAAAAKRGYVRWTSSHAGSGPQGPLHQTSGERVSGEP